MAREKMYPVTPTPIHFPVSKAREGYSSIAVVLLGNFKAKKNLYHA